VASAPHSVTVLTFFSKALLRPRAFVPSVRALDAIPARETLMMPIMFNATAPVGCASDLARLGH